MELNAAGEVISGYLTPDEAREAGVAWAGRPNEPEPYRTEDESRAEGRVYESQASYDARVGNYQYNDRALLGSVVTTMGATESARSSPTVGPTGLAYPDDPVNYATGQVGASQGYNGLQSGVYGGAHGAPTLAGVGPLAGGADNTMIYLLLAGAAVAAYFLFVK